MGGVVGIVGGALSVADVVSVATEGAVVRLAARAREAIRESAAALVQAVESGAQIYGLTSGVGGLHDVGAAPQAQNNLNLLRSHAAGGGADMSVTQVRAMMLVRLNALAGGCSGVRLEVPELLVAMLNAGITPRIRIDGSVGASDLSALAQLGLAMAGLGERVGPDDFTRAGLTPVSMDGRDALALINGPAQTVALSALALHAADRVIQLGEVAAALSMSALGSHHSFLDKRIGDAKPHPGSQLSASRLRMLRREDSRVETSAGNDGAGLARDPLSVRCAHHVLGAARQAADYARPVVREELAGAVDNPMIAGDGWRTSNASNFDGTLLAQCLDLLSNALTGIAVISERRTARLLDPSRNRARLPAFMVPPGSVPGAHSGLMVAQYTAAGEVAALRAHSIPASIQSIDVSAGYEDYVSMSYLAARRIGQAIDSVTRVLGVEMLCAVQGIATLDLRPSPNLARWYDAIRSEVAEPGPDRRVDRDLDRVIQLVTTLPLDD